MRTIINGKAYDTETASQVAQASYKYPNDHGHSDEPLYRKKTGEYFIYGIGSPRYR